MSKTKSSTKKIEIPNESPYMPGMFYCPDCTTSKNWTVYHRPGEHILDAVNHLAKTK